MRLRDMKVKVRYVVTKGGTTLNVGDHVWLDDDRFILSAEAAGWLTPEDWSRLRNEVKFDVVYYRQRQEALRKQIAEIETLIKENQDVE